MSVTPRHGKNSSLWLDSTAGTLVNFSSGVRTSSLNRSMDAPEVTTYGDNDRNFIAGLRGAELSFEGIFSSTHAEVLDGVFGDATSTSYSFEWSPDGSTAAGRHLLKGEGLLTSLEYGASFDDAVSMSGTLLITGAVSSTNH